MAMHGDVLPGFTPMNDDDDFHPHVFIAPLVGLAIMGVGAIDFLGAVIWLLLR